MKKASFLFALFIGGIVIAHAQEIRPAKSQEDYEEKKKVYFPVEENQIKTMQNNWDMYFKEDVASVIDKKSKDYLFEIKLDSYGSVYPAQEILDGIPRDDFNGDKKSRKFLESNSFWWLFKKDEGVIADKAKTTKNAAIYQNLLKLSKGSSLREEDQFFDRWDSLHIGGVCQQLNTRIKKDKINKVIFFVHGYNVPYSLAVLQALTFYKVIKDTLNVPVENTLLVPVYWPSNNEKYDSLRQENFTTENIKTFKNNGALFLRYSNRCYYAAITLRQIINALNPSVDVNIIAHSLGATIATSCLINTWSKLDYNSGSSLKANASNRSWVLSQNRNNFNGKDNINIDLLKRFYNTPLPARKVGVFLSAGAIPGLHTFQDLDVKAMKNKFFYSTINQFDEMVTKTDIKDEVRKRFFIRVSYINAFRLSATSLGCNADGEADKTRVYYNTRLRVKDAFVTSEVSKEWDHDVFTYLQQPDYKDFLKKFLLHP